MHFFLDLHSTTALRICWQVLCEHSWAFSSSILPLNLKHCKDAGKSRIHQSRFKSLSLGLVYRLRDICFSLGEMFSSWTFDLVSSCPHTTSSSIFFSPTSLMCQDYLSLSPSLWGSGRTCFLPYVCLGYHLGLRRPLLLSPFPQRTQDGRRNVHFLLMKSADNRRWRWGLPSLLSLGCSSQASPWYGLWTRVWPIQWNMGAKVI